MKIRISEIVNDGQKLKLKLKIKISTRIGLDLLDLLLVARWYPPSFTASKLEIPILGRPRSNEINLYLAITRVNFLQKAGINHRVEGMEGRRACRHDTVINCASFARLPHPWINFNDSAPCAARKCLQRNGGIYTTVGRRADTRISRFEKWGRPWVWIYSIWISTITSFPKELY